MLRVVKRFFARDGGIIMCQGWRKDSLPGSVEGVCAHCPWPDMGLDSGKQITGLNTLPSLREAGLQVIVFLFFATFYRTLTYLDSLQHYYISFSNQLYHSDSPSDFLVPFRVRYVPPKMDMYNYYVR